MDVKWAIRLYPRAWRDRYEEEFLEVLNQNRNTWMTLLDLLLGALDTHLYPQVQAKEMWTMTTWRRTSVVTVLWAWTGFAIAGALFGKLSEDPPYHALARAHTSVGVAYDVVWAGALASLAALLAGGLPIAYAACRSAMVERRQGLFVLFTVPVLALALAVAVTIVLTSLAGSGTATLSMLLVFLGVWLLAAVASTLAASTVVVRSRVGDRLFKNALLCAAPLTIGMAVVTAATLIWSIGLRHYAPSLYAGEFGLMRSSTALGLGVIVLLMALFTILSAGAMFRGFHGPLRVSPRGNGD